MMLNPLLVISCSNFNLNFFGFFVALTFIHKWNMALSVVTLQHYIMVCSVVQCSSESESALHVCLVLE